RHHIQAIGKSHQLTDKPVNVVLLRPTQTEKGYDGKRFAILTIVVTDAQIYFTSYNQTKNTGSLLLYPTKDQTYTANDIVRTYALQITLAINIRVPGDEPQRVLMSHIEFGAKYIISVKTPLGANMALIDFRQYRTYRKQWLLPESWRPNERANVMCELAFLPQISNIVHPYLVLANIKTNIETMFVLVWCVWGDIARYYIHFFRRYMEDIAPQLYLYIILKTLSCLQSPCSYEKDLHISNLVRSICNYGNTCLCFSVRKQYSKSFSRKTNSYRWPVMCIHGDKNQQERDWVLQEFRVGKTPILIATDVASRGLDVDDIKFVINFDYPNSSEDYVHRIGRTARANNTGTAYTFFTQNNCKQAADLISVLREANQQVNPKLVQLGESARFLGKGRNRYSRGGGGGRDDRRGGGGRFGDRDSSRGGRGGGFGNKGGSYGSGGGAGGRSGYGASSGGSSFGGANRSSGFSNGGQKGFGNTTGATKGFGNTTGATKGFGNTTGAQKGFGNTSGGQKGFGNTSGGYSQSSGSYNQTQEGGGHYNLRHPQHDASQGQMNGYNNGYSGQYTQQQWGNQWNTSSQPPLPAGNPPKIPPPPPV
ncbi:Hypothetical predicted protein, partial [Mytilus galloprovincialis]